MKAILAFLIGAVISTNVMAGSCSSSSFKRASRIVEKYEKAVDKATDFYNDDRVLSEAASLGRLFEKMDEKNHHEVCYKVHSSCARAGDSENSDRAF